jgi:hypothetical protein
VWESNVIRDGNFRDLEEMVGNPKALKKNNEEFDGILIGPSMVPHSFGQSEIPSTWVFHPLPSLPSRLRAPCGTDGKPTGNTQSLDETAELSWFEMHIANAAVLEHDGRAIVQRDGCRCRCCPL